MAEQNTEYERPQRFRKKPVEIEAIRFADRLSGPHVALWCGGEYYKCLMDGNLVAHPDPYILIPTLEGKMVASVGDWIIKGVKGEFYPCKPDIFEATYEPAQIDSSGRPEASSRDKARKQ